jgi:hypothetical protein
MLAELVDLDITGYQCWQNWLTLTPKKADSYLNPVECGVLVKQDSPTFEQRIFTVEHYFSSKLFLLLQEEFPN